ncbi:MAG: biotin-dependent carboxyltransferase family protein [Pseudomonadota bacterium]
MKGTLIVHRAGPGITVQDLGRAGYLGFGLSRSGAADPLALFEGAALLGQDVGAAALEIAISGGVFEATASTRIALTGAPMPASIDGARIAWNASHALHPGARLEIGSATQGVYGYLHVDGGFDTALTLGSRSTHLGVGLGAAVSAGHRLPIKPGSEVGAGLGLQPMPRFEGGKLRMVDGPQTHLFSSAEIERFTNTVFRRSSKGNRMGVGLAFDGEPFHTEFGLKILSEIIVQGDVQITGDGTPFALMSECQTTGGYPRIGSIIPPDLPRLAQTPSGAELGFEWISLEDAVIAEQEERERRETLRAACFPLVRDPKTIDNLLSHQLVSGVTAGDD